MIDFSSWIISGHRYRDLLAVLAEQKRERPWLAFFCEDDPAQIRCGALNATCRLEPIPFDDSYVDRLFFLSEGAHGEELLGGALTMRIAWDGSAANLPAGWQGVVRQSYRDSSADGKGCNTLVGMQLFTISHHRNKGLSSRFMGEMLNYCARLGYPYCIVPALCPIQHMKEYVERPFEDLAYLKRDDGLPVDHWTRLHVRKGAEILGHCDRSHRFALSLADFSSHISSDPLPTTGYHTIRLNRDISFGLSAKNTWQRVYADLERDLVCFNWGCVWVKYDLAKLGIRG